MVKSVQYNGFKIGRLRMTIAKAINKRCADIYISDTHIKHIERKHSKELEQLGIGAFEYVKTIVSNFNQILKGSGVSILLVIKTKSEIHHVAAVSLNYCTKKGIWEVKTAQPRRTSEIERKKILWQNCPSSE